MFANGTRVRVYAIKEKNDGVDTRNADIDRILFIHFTKAKRNVGQVMSFFRNDITANDSETYNQINEYLNSKPQSRFYISYLYTTGYQNVETRRDILGLQNMEASRWRYSGEY